MIIFPAECGQDDRLMNDWQKPFLLFDLNIELLQLPLLLKPFPYSFMLCVVFCFHVTDNLLKWLLVMDTIKKRVMLYQAYPPKLVKIHLIKFIQILISLLFIPQKSICGRKIIMSAPSLCYRS